MKINFIGSTKIDNGEYFIINLFKLSNLFHRLHQSVLRTTKSLEKIFSRANSTELNECNDINLSFLIKSLSINLYQEFQ